MRECRPVVHGARRFWVQTKITAGTDRNGEHRRPRLSWPASPPGTSDRDDTWNALLNPAWAIGEKRESMEIRWLRRGRQSRQARTPVLPNSHRSPVSVRLASFLPCAWFRLRRVGGWMLPLRQGPSHPPFTVALSRYLVPGFWPALKGLSCTFSPNGANTCFPPTWVWQKSRM